MIGRMNPTPGIYGWSPGSGGVHYHRIAEPLRVAAAGTEQFEATNAHHGIVLDDEVLERHDTILVHMLHDERNSDGWQRLAAMGTHRMIFDMDDAMWARDAAPWFREYYTDDVMARVWLNVARAHVVTTPSPFIADKVAEYNPNVWIVPNSVPEDTLKIRFARPFFTVGYQGSPHHFHDEHGDFTQELAHAVLGAVNHSRNWRMHFYGLDSLGAQLPAQTVAYAGWPGQRTTWSSWKRPGFDYYRQLQMDIGLAPVRDSQFNRGKSGLRAIEYAALGIVGVFTDHELYKQWVIDGQTGILLAQGADWGAVLTDLMDEPDELRAMSYAARARARAFTTEAQIGHWVQAWNSI
jgi:glycosyltransferase involved in cell wall biosynthesis